MPTSNAISEPRKRRLRSPKVRPRTAVATARIPSATSVRMRSRRTVVRSCWPGARAVGS